ncbi:D-alanyl-D-alanine carboxypeptidase [Weissella confusa]|uniref:D-alanyl-D-alanine carboxypeptidase n=2 Tax=Weissella confusa TaxID=1583 RepID=A0A0R2F200_WEICO|nr:serine hydrolase [Weissella confusa]COI20572.1 D-alanyl-D-alanine carboxypeptidase [Streptococcus pneumoniae]KRN22552.1 D-alanyl-D-alanine carboxypeptidase [Weissella confusa]MBJ7616344.1 D-alanyl-D-alanine carboxypeptidase [Weissella confusa]MBJ7625704.1 D-alanyl-D-alanine carboxypeptidase [Weissella confusa]MBJ7628702.1 D-alanyl-D-alanine carboxypeptidase [Weissella confusa]
MRKVTKQMMAGLMAAGVLASVGTSASAALVDPGLQSTKAGVVVDAQTGQVIADQNGTERLPIASTTKLITMYMVKEAIKSGKISLSQKVKVPEDIAAFSQDLSVANTPMTAEKTYTVQQLIDAMMVPSSNGAALLLANLLGGSQAKFEKMMEAKLESWGIAGVKIYSPSGLTNGDMKKFKDASAEDDVENEMSARELAVVARRLVVDFPDVLKTAQQKTVEFPAVSGGTETMNNTNELLGNETFDLNWLGLKTGTTPNAGGNFVGVTKIQGRPVVSVVLNSGDNADAAAKFNATLTMVKKADDAVKVQKVASGLKPAKNTVSVLTAKDGKVSYKTKGTASFFVPAGESATTKAVNVKLSKKVTAPLKQNEKLGTAQLESSFAAANDWLTGAPEVELVSVSEEARANWFATTWRGMFGKSNYDITATK